MSQVLPTALFTVDPALAGERLDAFLAQQAEALSRSRLKALIRDGQVMIGGQPCREASFRIRGGDVVQLTVPPPLDAEPTPEAISLDVVHEDEHLLVVDKPAGLVVHPAAGNWSGTLVNALLHHCGDSLSGIGGIRRPGIVHRLDKDTSGLMVVAKTDLAHAGLAAQFADHGRSGDLVREYQALVWGMPRPAAGSIDAPLDRDPRNRQRQAVARSGGRRAVTHYRVKESYGDGLASLMALHLETGRTHQIRVHLAHIGHPLLGDPTYGAGYFTKATGLPANIRQALTGLNRQALHAGMLGFRHPVTGQKLRFASQPPADLAELIERFRQRTV